MATFPVYRTYLQPGRPASEFDCRTIERAVARARKRNPTIDQSVFDFVRSILGYQTGVDAGAVPDLAAATLAPLLRGTQVVLP